MANRKLWGIMGAGLVVFAAVSACSDADEVAGAGDAGEGGEQTTPGGAAGKPAAGGNGGAQVGGMGGAGMGGVNDDGGEGGVAGCSVSDECGGCDAGYFIVKCSWGEATTWHQSEDAQQQPQAACDYARQFFAGAGEGGAGGAAGAAGAANAEQGGAWSNPGLCESYVAPGTRITGCDSGYTETEHETKVGECVIRDECCVLVSFMGCGI